MTAEARLYVTAWVVTKDIKNGGGNSTRQKLLEMQLKQNDFFFAEAKNLGIGYLFGISDTYRACIHASDTRMWSFGSIHASLVIGEAPKVLVGFI